MIFSVLKKTSFVHISHQSGALPALHSQAEDSIAPLKSSHDLEAPHCIVLHYIALRYKGSIYLRRSLLYSGIHFATSRYCVLFIAPDLYIYNISSPCMEDTLLTRVLHPTAIYIEATIHYIQMPCFDGKYSIAYILLPFIKVEHYILPTFFVCTAFHTTHCLHWRQALHSIAIQWGQALHFIAMHWLWG